MFITSWMYIKKIFFFLLDLFANLWDAHPVWTVIFVSLGIAVFMSFYEYFVETVLPKIKKRVPIIIQKIKLGISWIGWGIDWLIHWIYMITVGWMGLVYARLFYGKKQKEYYLDSTDVRHIYYIKDGEKNGLESFYYHNGKLNKKCFWKKGQKQPIEKIYFPNGKLFLVLEATNDEEEACIKNIYPIVKHRKKLILPENAIKELRSVEKTCNEEFAHYKRISKPLRKKGDSKWLKVVDAVAGRYTQQAHDIQDAWDDLSGSLQEITEKRLDILREAIERLQKQTSWAMENTLASYLRGVKEVGARPKAKEYRGSLEAEFEHIEQQRFDELADELSEFKISERGWLGKRAGFAIGGVIGGILKITWDVIWDTDQLTKITEQAAKLAKQAAKIQASWVILDGLVKHANELTRLTYEINSRCEQQLQYLLALAPDFKKKHPFYIQKWENVYELMQGLSELLETVSQWGKTGELSSAGLKTLEHTQKLLTTSELINYER